MSAYVTLVLALIVSSVSLAAAQPPPRPQIPSSEMPGRERERFVDSPIWQFQQQQERNRPVVTGPGSQGKCGARKSKSKKRKVC